MERLGQPAGGPRRKTSLLEEVLSTLAFLILFFTGLSILNLPTNSTSFLGSLFAVTLFSFGAYGTALDILDLLDMIGPPLRQSSAHSTH